MCEHSPLFFYLTIGDRGTFLKVFLNTNLFPEKQMSVKKERSGSGV